MANHNKGALSNARHATRARVQQSARFHFMDHVKKTDGGCWEWTLSGRGKYGNIYNGEKNEAAHRFAYRTFVGQIPSGANICHKCDNRKCVRPEHLFAASQGENLKDMYRKGRQGIRRIPRGASVSTAKLTAEKVREIRKAYANGEARMPALARLFGVSLENISHIVHRRSWRHVQ